MGEFSLSHILLVLVVLLIFFGPSRLPGLGASFGKAIREFKDGLKEANKEVKSDPQGNGQAKEQLNASDAPMRSEVDADRAKNQKS